MKKFKLTWQHFLFCILIIAILGALVNYLYFNEDNNNIETLQNMDNKDNKFPKNYFKGSPADGIDDFERETGMTCTPYKSVTGSGEKPSLFEGINACREDKDCTGLLWVSQLHQNARDKAEKKGKHREGGSYLCNKPLQNIVGFKPEMGDAIAYLKSGFPHAIRDTDNISGEQEQSASELEELKRSKDKDNVFGKMGKETKLGKGGNLAKEGFTNLSYSSINNQGPLNCPNPLTPYEKYNCGPVNVNNIFGNIQFKPECCGNPADQVIQILWDVLVFVQNNGHF